MDPQSHLCQIQQYSLVSIPVCAASHSSLPYRRKVVVLGKNPVHVPFHWSLHLEYFSFLCATCLKLSTFNSQLHSPFLRLLPHALNCLPFTHSSTHHFSVSSHLAHTVWAVSHRLLTPCPHCVSSIPHTSQILPTLCERYPTDFPPFPHYVSGIPQTTHPAHTMWVAVSYTHLTLPTSVYV